MKAQINTKKIALTKKEIAYILAGLYLLEECAENEEPIGKRSWNVMQELGADPFDVTAIQELRERVNGG